MQRADFAAHVPSISDHNVEFHTGRMGLDRLDVLGWREVPGLTILWIQVQYQHAPSRRVRDRSALRRQEQMRHQRGEP